MEYIEATITNTGNNPISVWIADGNGFRELPLAHGETCIVNRLATVRAMDAPSKECIETTVDLRAVIKSIWPEVDMDRMEDILRIATASDDVMGVLVKETQRAEKAYRQSVKRLTTDDGEVMP